MLQSAEGPLPNLAEQIAGEPISGSWWGHASGHEIFAALTRLLDSSEVIATRLVNGRITLIHRRLWPALVRSPTASRPSASQPSTRCTPPRVPIGRSRSPSPSGSRPQPSTLPRCCPSIRHSRCCPPACADGPVREVVTRRTRSLLRGRPGGPGGRARRRSWPGGPPRRTPRPRPGRSPPSSCRWPRTACHRCRSPSTSRSRSVSRSPRGGAEDVADRDRAAEHGGGVLAHRVVGEGDEVVVPGEDLRPVGLLGAGRVVVQGGDRGLDLVAAGALNGQRRLQDAHALGDLAGVPQAAVLVVERDDTALGVESRREAGVAEEHQREQPARLRFLGGEGELAGEPDRLAGQVHPAGRGRPCRRGRARAARRRGRRAGPGGDLARCAWPG